jgi:hypothetical protein
LVQKPVLVPGPLLERVQAAGGNEAGPAAIDVPVAAARLLMDVKALR